MLRHLSKNSSESWNARMTILTRPAGIKIETRSPTRRSYDREAVTRSMQRPPLEPRQD
jgi:hypothetical protein